MVTCSNCGNALHYGLPMFLEFGKLPYPSVISISVRFQKPSHLLLWNLLSKQKFISYSAPSYMEILSELTSTLFSTIEFLMISNCTLHKWTVECLLLPLLFFPSLLESAWFVVRQVSFVKQIVSVVFPDNSFAPLSLQYSSSYASWRCLLLHTSSMISSLIFLNKSFPHLNVDKAS